MCCYACRLTVRTQPNWKQNTNRSDCHYSEFQKESSTLACILPRQHPCCCEQQRSSVGQKASILEEFITEKATDSSFEQTAASVRNEETWCIIDMYGLVIRKVSVDEAISVLGTTVRRKPLVYCYQHPVSSDHSGQRRMYNSIGREATFRTWQTKYTIPSEPAHHLCATATDRYWKQKRSYSLQNGSLEFIAIDIFGL